MTHETFEADEAKLKKVPKESTLYGTALQALAMYELTVSRSGNDQIRLYWRNQFTVFRDKALRPGA